MYSSFVAPSNTENETEEGEENPYDQVPVIISAFCRWDGEREVSDTST